MPRSHGRIIASIWNDGDFLALPEGPQRLYLFLLSQPDLSHAGLVPMRVRRWAKKVADVSIDRIEGLLVDLESSRFIVADEDTQEVLVRTFVRNDGVYKQPKVMMRLREDAKLIESPLLRSAFRAELDRLPLHELADGPRVQVEKVVGELLADFSDVSAGRYPSERVSGRVSDTHSDTPPERVSDTPRVRAGAFPQPPSPFPQPPSTIPATPGDGEPSRALAVVGDSPTAQTLVAEWIEHCADRPPGRVVGQVAKELKTLLDEGISPDRIRRALAEWNRKGLHPATLPSVVHEIANRAPAARGQQATDDLFDAAMQRAIERDGSTR